MTVQLYKCDKCGVVYTNTITDTQKCKIIRYDEKDLVKAIMNMPDICNGEITRIGAVELIEEDD